MKDGKLIRDVGSNTPTTIGIHRWQEYWIQSSSTMENIGRAQIDLHRVTTCLVVSAESESMNWSEGP